LVPLVLEVTPQLARVGLDGDRRRRVEVVPRPLIAKPRRGVSGAPEREVQVRIIRARDPDGCTAALPCVAGPRLVAWLAGAGNRERLPRWRVGLSVKRLDKTHDAELAAGHTDHDLSLGDERGERHVVARLVVFDRLLPGDLPRLRVEGDEKTVEAC